MNINSFQSWYDGIVKHYGTLNGFDDFRTIEIMREGLVKEINNHHTIIEEISDPDSRAEYAETFSEEFSAALDYLDLLDDWLYDKGYTG